MLSAYSQISRMQPKTLVVGDGETSITMETK